MTPAMEVAERDSRENAARSLNQWARSEIMGSNYHQFCPSESWRPAINVLEDEDSIVIVVELAGIRADEIDLGVEEGMLTLSGHRPAAGLDELAGAQLHLMEIDHGRFCRKIDLPENIDEEAITASYRNGYLWIRAAKTKV